MTAPAPARHHPWSMDDVVRTLEFNGVGGTMLGFAYPPIGCLVAPRDTDVPGEDAASREPNDMEGHR